MLAKSEDGFEQVSRAVICQWIALGVGIINTAIRVLLTPGPPHLSFAAYLAVSAAGTLIYIALAVWLIIKISAGRNWARITLLVLFVIGVPFWLLGMSHLIRQAPLEAGFSVIITLLQFYALVLMFTVPGRYWFQQR